MACRVATGKLQPRSPLTRLTSRHYVEAHHDAFELRPRRRVLPHDQRVVPGDDVMRARRIGAQDIVSVEHVADVECCGERPARLHVLVILPDGGSQPDPATARMYAD